ncbi:MAG: serine/threonine-protein kinase [Gemmatimonadales bacterium]|jgi:serine/threonine-protein kinase
MSRPSQRILTRGEEWQAPPGRGDNSKSGLPLSLLQQSSRRLQFVCAVAAVLLVIYWIITNWGQGELAAEFQDPLQWVPPTMMLSASLVVLVLARSRWLSPSAIVTVGLVYMVVFSFCMPLSEYYNAFVGIDPQYLSGDLVGLSGVAIWMLFFTVLVPSKPRHALIALTLSGSAVPITIALLAGYGNAPKLPAADFFDLFVGPYVFIVIMSYIAARIIYRLGTDIRRARELGSYHLLDLIGRGGMGEVWRAKHNMLARPAAIKLIRRDLIASDPGAVQTALDRFEREAQVTASLESPHTVDLYDYGISEDGNFYYVMELLDGVDLESLVHRSGPLPAERVIHLLCQTCRSLSEAHRRDLVHRDIKPSNIFLCRRAFEYDFVKVLDFGLVKPGSALEPGSERKMTETGVVAGTPDFIAPELAVGDGVVDGRSDIYSLGCVAYWLLTGQHVFEKDTSIATIVAHINAVPEAPSTRTELPIPVELESLVLACLSKAPAGRPASADQLERALNEIALETPWTQDRAAEWWSLHFPSNSLQPDRTARR